MLGPDQRLFEADLQLAEYRNGVAKGLWNHVVGDALPEGTVWPSVCTLGWRRRRVPAPPTATMSR